MASGIEYLLVGLAAVAAGVVNALAGGGTLITFPTLTAVGIPAVTASVTNTVALCPGYLGATLAQANDLRGQRRRLWLILPAAALGGVAGGLLLLNTGERVFRALVPFLILLAAGLLAAQDPLRAWLARRAQPDRRVTDPPGASENSAASVPSGSVTRLPDRSVTDPLGASENSAASTPSGSATRPPGASENSAASAPGGSMTPLPDRWVADPPGASENSAASAPSGSPTRLPDRSVTDPPGASENSAASAPGGSATRSPETWAALPVGLAAIYGGYFGAGLSVITLAVLGLTLDDSLTRLNALKQAIALSANVAAAILFIFSGEPEWPMVAVMAVGSLLGGVLGGRLASRIPPAALRRVVVVVGVVVGVIYLVR